LTRHGRRLGWEGDDKDGIMGCGTGGRCQRGRHVSGMGNELDVDGLVCAGIGALAWTTSISRQPRYRNGTCPRHRSAVPTFEVFQLGVKERRNRSGKEGNLAAWERSTEPTGTRRRHPLNNSTSSPSEWHRNEAKPGISFS